MTKFPLPVRVLLAALLPVLLFVPCRAAAAAQSGSERILLYDVTAVFEPGGSMNVTENITVRAGGNRIRRGIFRTLPTSWQRPDNKRFRTEFTIKSVRKNGSPEPYSLSRTSKALTVYVGNREVTLRPGVYKYTIVYTVSNHFSRFPDYDELYWNVTGNAWDFPIDKARFKLLFRKADGTLFTVPMQSVDAYTGRLDSRARNARKNADGSIETTLPLGRGEGLTVAYAWDRGILAAPDPEEDSPLRRLFLPSARTAFFWLAPLAVAGYFLFRRNRMGRGLHKPEVIPLFRPPGGLSPGELRYVTSHAYDGDAFAGDLLSLVTKGAISLVPGSSPPVLEKGGRPNPGAGILEPEERDAVGRLFPSGAATVTMSRGNNRLISSARALLARRATSEKPPLFQKRFGAILPGVFLLFLLSVGASLLFGYADLFALNFWLLFISVWFGALFFVVAGTWRQRTGIAKIGILIPMAPFFFAGGFVVYQFLPLLSEFVLPDGYLGAILATIACCVGGALLLPGRTQEGLNRLAVAEGLRMYLGTAEEKRFEALYPPADSVERFEALLPFALALGVGKTWANRFASYLAATGQVAQSFQSLNTWSDLRSFRSYSHTASRSPRSSSGGSGGRFSGSGSFGGGSSGRGTGGGGGGGW